MAKSSKTKGHRFNNVGVFHIQYYSTPFFDPDGEPEEGEVKKTKETMVKLPVKIAANGDNSRSNVTNFELKSISHFDNNIENVLESISQLIERVIKPKAITDMNEAFKTTLKMLQLICRTGTAMQTLQEVMKKAREEVVTTRLNLLDDVQRDILISEEKTFYAHLEREDHSFDAELFDDNEAYVNSLFLDYKHSFWNQMHTIIFGANAYRAFKQQKDYLLNKVVKPYGVLVEAAFRRIDVIANLMEFSPPPHSRKGVASQPHWNNFKEIKKLSDDLKREIKYNLLPEAFHDRFKDMEGDWTKWSNNKFLAQAQKAEAVNAKERRCTAEQKEKQKKRKSLEDDDSSKNLSCSQRAKNKRSKEEQDEEKETTQGQARVCELCKLAGAPDFVFKSHFTNQCNCKD